MYDIKKAFAATAAVCLILTGCGKNSEGTETSETTAAKPDFSTAETEAIAEDDAETVSIYTGKAVENGADGKQYSSPYGGIVVKAQNYKEEFQDLDVFADSGCASIKVNNMLYQADTEFSDPIKTTVAGFDAIRYDYTVTSYIFPPVTDADGGYVTGDDGNYVLSEDKEVNGVFVDRVYYFYSDEDVFYIICESKEDSAEEATAAFDQFIESVSISK